MSWALQIAMADGYWPAQKRGEQIKIIGRKISAEKARERVKAGKDVYTTRKLAKALSKAIGGGKHNKFGKSHLMEPPHKDQKTKSIEGRYKHYHDPHRDKGAEGRGQANEPKKARKKMGHIFYGEPA